MMDERQEVMERFLKYESEQALFDNLKIDGIAYWKYVRTEIWRMICYIKFNFIDINGCMESSKRKTQFRDYVDRYLLRNPMLSSHKDVLVFNHERRIKRGKYYKCNYTDEWLSDFNLSYCVCEREYGGEHFKPVRTKNLKYIYYGDKLKKRKKTNVKAECDRLIEKIENDFQCKFYHDQKKRLLNLFNRIANDRSIIMEYYEKLLKRIKPKIVILVVSYSFDRMLLIEVAKKRGIPVVEMEHGSIGQGHVAYNFYEKRNLETFPDYIFTFGKYDKIVPRYPIDRSRIIPVGSAQLESEFLLYNKLLANKKKKRKIITFFSNGHKELIDCAYELSQKIDPAEYKIIVKLHPAEYGNWNKLYPNLKNSSIEVADGKKHNIYYYLTVSDYSIGVSSTTLIESTMFDTNILILKVGKYFEMSGIIEQGFGKFVNSADDIFDYVMSGKSTRDDHVDPEMFFAKNAKANIYAAIDQIIGKKHGEKKNANKEVR